MTRALSHLEVTFVTRDVLCNKDYKGPMEEDMKTPTPNL